MHLKLLHGSGFLFFSFRGDHLGNVLSICCDLLAFVKVSKFSSVKERGNSINTVTVV